MLTFYNIAIYAMLGSPSQEYRVEAYLDRHGRVQNFLIKSEISNSQ
jgi:hypothetical protein